MKTKELQVVALFNLDANFITKINPLIQVWAQKFKAQIQSPAIPVTAPPEVPRIILQTKQLSLAISLNRITLTYFLQENENSTFKSFVSFFWQQHKDFFVALRSIGIAEFKMAIFTKVAFSSANQKNFLEISKLLHESLFKQKITKLPTQVHANLGYQEIFGFVNYSLAPYESRQINQALRGQVINLQQAPIVDTGVEVVVEINNLSQPLSSDLDKQFLNLSNNLFLLIEDMPLVFFSPELLKVLNINKVMN